MKSTSLHRRFLILPGILALASLATGQHFVHPSHHANAEALSSNALPLGSSTTPVRVVQIHDGVPAGTIRGMAFRLDASQIANVPAFSAFVEVHMSTAATTPSAPSATFDANHGLDRVQVLPPTIVQFPAAPFGLAPRDFTHVITFATPFVHAGTAPLCWDMRITTRSVTTSFMFDYVVTSSNPSPQMVSFGVGCTVPGNTSRMTLSGTPSVSWTNGTVQFAYGGSRLPANGIVALSLGVSATSFAGLTLPFELPGSASAPSGACTIYNDPLAQLPAFTTATGTLVGGTNVALSINPSMHGLSLFTQLLAFDPAANPFGILTTNSLQQHLVSPLTTAAIGIVQRIGSSQATGTVNASRGTVVRFDY